MTFDEAIVRFQCQRRGTGWIGRCPAHDDRRPSLSVGLGGDGRILLHCHAGCPLDAVLAAAGLTVADLFSESTATTARSIVAEYGYRDERGELLFHKVRYVPKAFALRRADGEWTMQGVRRVLYRLPELQGKSIAYIVEGEKDADRLRTEGLPGTTSVSGAGDWCNEYTEQLIAAKVERVVILPDNDDAGRAHAEKVARSCYTAGLKAKVVTLPLLPEKSDVSTWLNAGHTAQELAALVSTVEFYQPEGPPILDHQLDLVTLADVEPEQIDWIWPGRVARRKYTLISGDPGLGESTLSLGIAAHLSRGMPWPDGGAAPRGRTLILSAEDGIADTMRPRVDRLGADPSQIFILRAVRDGRDARPLNLARDLSQLAEAIRCVEPLLVIIDPITAYLGKTDSYKDAEVRGLLTPVLAVLEEKNVALIAVGHLAKGEQRAALHRPSGSIAFVAAARIVLCLAADPDDGERRVLAGLKSNLGPLPPSLAFRLPDGELTWERGPVALDAEELLRPAVPGDREQRITAQAFMQELLADDARWPLDAKDAIAEAEARGISERTLRRVATKEGVQIQRYGFGKGGRSVWSRPSIPDTRPSLPPTSGSLAGMAGMEEQAHILDNNNIGATHTCTTGVDRDDDDYRV